MSIKNVHSLPVFIYLLSFVVGFVVAAWVRKNAATLGLVQSPNGRSSHAIPTPNGGGLGIVLGGTLAGLFLLTAGYTQLWPVIVLALLLAGVSFWDDIRSLPVVARLLAHFVLCGLLLSSIGGLPSVAIPGVLTISGFLLFTLLIFAGVWWISLFNFMDGIDGIAGSQAVFMLLAAALLCINADRAATDYAVWHWMIAVLAATAGFCLLNWPPAKVFMGDVGSTYLPFMILAFACYTIKAGMLTYAAWTILPAVFVVDATVTLLRRMIAREKIYEAHHNHAYQKLSRRFAGERQVRHLKVTVLTVAINVLWVLPLAWLAQSFPDHAFSIALLCYLLLTTGAFLAGAGRPDIAP